MIKIIRWLMTLNPWYERSLRQKYNKPCEFKKQKPYKLVVYEKRLETINKYTEEEFLDAILSLSDEVFKNIVVGIKPSPHKSEQITDFLQIAGSLKNLSDNDVLLINANNNMGHDYRCIFPQETQPTIRLATKNLSDMGFLYWIDDYNDHPPYESCGQIMCLDQRVVDRLLAREDIMACLHFNSKKRGNNL